MCASIVASLAWQGSVTFGDPRTSLLKTSFHRKIRFRTATGSSHPKQLSYTRASKSRRLTRDRNKFHHCVLCHRFLLTILSIAFGVPRIGKSINSIDNRDDFDKYYSREALVIFKFVDAAVIKSIMMRNFMPERAFDTLK